MLAAFFAAFEATAPDFFVFFLVAPNEGTPAFACHVGNEKTELTPPPVAPPPDAWSFQTTSDWRWPLLAVSAVPPQPSTCGLDAGKSTLLPLSPSEEPLSPAATVIVMPRAAADWQVVSMLLMAVCDQVDSGPPQEMEMTLGLFLASWIAVEMAS